MRGDPSCFIKAPKKAIIMRILPQKGFEMTLPLVLTSPNENQKVKILKRDYLVYFAVEFISCNFAPNAPDTKYKVYIITSFHFFS